MLYAVSRRLASLEPAFVSRAFCEERLQSPRRPETPSKVIDRMLEGLGQLREADPRRPTGRSSEAFACS